jgi:hypothetical protein
MKRFLVVAALLVSTVVNAQADQLVVRWYDTIRPHGHKRSAVIGRANVEHCNQAIGRPDGSISSAYEACMQDLGYQLMGADLKRSPAKHTVTIYNRDSRDPAIGWHTEGGMRVCHSDCDNPEIPGSGYVCRDVEAMGMAMRQCTKNN